MKKSLIFISVILCCFVCQGEAEDGVVSSSSTITGTGQSGFLSFQTGVANYNSTVDVEISSQNLGSWNGYLGVTYPTGFMYIAKSPTSSEEFRGLLRFNKMWVPSGATVNGANLTFTISSWDDVNKFQIKMDYLKVSWNPASPNLGWRDRDTNVQWGAMGANSSSDVVGSAFFVQPISSSNGISTYTVALDSSKVNNWISNDSTNYGILVTVVGSGSLSMYSSDMPEQNYRPKLRLSYSNTAQDAPVNVTMKTSQGQVLVTWSAPSSFAPNSYLVQYALNPFFRDATNITRTVNNATFAYVINTEYWVRVFAVYGDRSIPAASTPVSLVAAETPSAPSFISAKAYGPKQILLKWTQPTFAGGVLTAYRVQISNSSSFASFQSTDVSTSTFEYLASGLGTGVSYYVRVAAVNYAGPSPWATSGPIIPAIVPPNPPTDLRLFVNSSTSLRVSWNAPDNDGGSPVTGFVIQYSTSSSFQNVSSLDVPQASSPTRDVYLTGLTTNQGYWVRVAARNAVGTGEWCATNPSFAAPVSVDSKWKVMQYGYQKYINTVEALISTQNSGDWNSYNGLTSFANASTTFGLTNAKGIESRYLLKFENLTSIVPQGSLVMEAFVQLTCTNWGIPFVIDGYYMNASWVPEGNLGWTFRNGSATWTQPGGRSDVILNTSLTFPSESATGDFVKEIRLDPSIVQQWINNPSSNQGLMFVMRTSGASISVYTSKYADRTGYRPLLRIFYQKKSKSSDTTPAAPSYARPTVLSSKPRTIFVSTSGSDTLGAGVVPLPYRTVQRAIQMALPGDVIQIRNGVYPGQILIDKPSISIQSYPGEWAVIVSPQNNPEIANVITLDIGANSTKIQDLEIVGGYYYGIMFKTTWEWYDVSQRPLYATAARNILIENCKVHDTGSSLIKIVMFVSDVTIRKCHLFNAGARTANYGHGVEAVNAKKITVEDNYIHNVPGNGVHLVGGTENSLVQRNYISTCGLGGIFFGFYTETEYMDGIRNPLYYENIDSVARNNLIVNTFGAGIGLYAALRPVIYQNTIWGAAQTMQSPLLVNGIQHWDPATNHPLIGCQNITVFNNVLSKLMTARKGPIVEIREVTSWDGTKTIRAINGTIYSRNNIYYVADELSTPVFKWGVGAMFEDDFYDWTGNLTSWRGRTGDFASVEANPLLDSNYQPVSPCSPASKHGAPLTDIPSSKFPSWLSNSNLDDYNGVVRNTSEMDVGAFVSTSYGEPRLPPVSQVPAYNGSLNYFPPYSVLDWPYSVWAGRIFKTYVVSMSGNDSSNGTLEYPFATIQKAHDVSLPGDIIYIRNGSYAGFSVYKPNVTFATYPSDLPSKAKISCPVNNSDIVNCISFKGGSAENVLQNLDISGGYYYAIMFNQAGGGMNSLYWTWYRMTTTKKNPSPTLIDSCYVHHSGTNVIKISPMTNGLIFKNCEIAYSGVRGTNGLDPVPQNSVPDTEVPDEEIETPPIGDPTITGNGIDNRGGMAITVRDCYIHDIKGVGILLGGGAFNSVVNRNLVTKCDSIGIMLGSFNTETEYNDKSSNPELYENVGNTVSNNIVTACKGAGIGIYSAFNATIVHNTLSDVAKTMHAAVLFNMAPHYINASTETWTPNKAITFANNIIQQESSNGFTVELRTMRSRTANAPGFVAPNTPSDCKLPEQQSSSNSDPGVTKNADGSCPNFPPNHLLNADISSWPVHPNSQNYLQSVGVRPTCQCVYPYTGNNCPPSETASSCGYLHPDFGGYGVLSNGNSYLYGIPFLKVNGSQTKKVNVTFVYADESDRGPYPFPDNVPIEGAYPIQNCGPETCTGDRHVLVVDQETCLLYETWSSVPNPGYQSWQAGSGAIFNLTSNQYRPLGWTSADAAGLPIYPLLIRYDEVMSGQITHAIRMTVQYSQRAYVAPATHYASYDTDPNRPPMGLRFRLKSSFDCSSFSFEAQVICQALKTYGAIVADNGADWYLSGEANPNWNIAALRDVAKIPADQMEVVDSQTTLCVNPECTRVTPPLSYPTNPSVVDYEDISMYNNIYFKKGVYGEPYETSFVDRAPGRSFRGNLEEWQEFSGLEDSSEESDPMLDANLVPIVGSPANNRTAPRLTATDYYNRNRPTGSTQDLGASMYPAGSRSIPPNPSKVSSVTEKCQTSVKKVSTIYVDPVNGVDSSCRNGNLTLPFKSLKFAVKQASRGNTILLKSGNYTASIDINVPLTVSSLAGERATLRWSPFSEGETIRILPNGNGTLISNVNIMGGFNNALFIDSSNATIQNCTIHGSGMVAVYITNSKGAVGAVKLANNVIYNAGQREPRIGDGVRVEGASNVVITDNLIRDCRSSAIQVRGGSSSIQILRNMILNSQRGIVLGNDNYGTGLTVPNQDDDSCPWFSSASNPLCYDVMDAVVANNIIINTQGAGIALKTAKNAKIFHNTLYKVAHNYEGAVLLQATQHWIPEANNPLVSNDDVTITNNIITMPTFSAKPVVSIRKVTSWDGKLTLSGVGNNVDISNNMYFCHTDGVQLFHSKFAGNCSVKFSDDSQKQGKANQNLTSSIADPLLNSNMVPQTGSPALGISVPVTGVSSSQMIDFYGNPRPTPSSLGAVQSSSNINNKQLPGSFELLIATPSGHFVSNSSRCKPPYCWMPGWDLDGTGFSENAIWTQCLKNGTMFPANSEWNRDVSQLGTSPMSSAYVYNIGSSKNLHSDFGTMWNEYQLTGIPFLYVSGNHRKGKVNFLYSSESDPGPYPLPEDPRIEGSANINTGDRHLIMLDVDNCVLYEIYRTQKVDMEYRDWLAYDFYAESGAIFSLNSNALRPLGWTSADAAGLPIFPGLVNYYEVSVLKEIKHGKELAIEISDLTAIRFTAQLTPSAYLTPPATHFAATADDPTRVDLPPMGLRMRLKATFDCNSLGSNESKIVCVALKKYGMIMALIGI